MNAKAITSNTAQVLFSVQLCNYPCKVLSFWQTFRSSFDLLVICAMYHREMAVIQIL